MVSDTIHFPPSMRPQKSNYVSISLGGLKNFKGYDELLHNLFNRQVEAVNVNNYAATVR